MDTDQISNALNAEGIKGGQEVTAGDEPEEEIARMLSTVSMKIRKPGK